VGRLGSPELERAEGAGGEREAEADHWPQEVRRLLFEANQEAAALRAERASLLARTRSLQQEVEQARARNQELTGTVASLQSDLRARQHPPERPDRWMADLTQRAATTLKSSQEAAQGLVERARRRAVEIEAEALREAGVSRRRAESEAAKVLGGARYDAESILAGAQACAEELMAEAQRKRTELVALARRQRDQLRAEVDDLERRRSDLLKAYAAIRGPVDDAVRILQGVPQEPPPLRAPTPSRTRRTRRAPGTVEQVIAEGRARLRRSGDGPAQSSPRRGVNGAGPPTRPGPSGWG
jgi:chromosome segregation ATPase